MPAETTRLRLPSPTGGEPADGPDAVADLAEMLDDIAAVWDSGEIGSAPAPGLRGRFFEDERTGEVYWDTGRAWVALRTPPDSSVSLAKLTSNMRADGTARATDQAVRALGFNPVNAAAGDDARFPTEAARVLRALPGGTVRAVSVDPRECTGSLALISGKALFVPVVWPLRANPQGAKWWQTVAGVYVASPTNKVALYRSDETDLVRVGVSSQLNGIWTPAARTTGTQAFDFTSPGTQDPGVYWIGMLWAASSVTAAPQIAARRDLAAGALAGIGRFGATGGYMAMAKTGMTELPATVAINTCVELADTPLVALY